MKIIKLPIDETNHLLDLLAVNELCGFAFGDKEKYWAIHKRIKDKLNGGIEKPISKAVRKYTDKSDGVKSKRVRRKVSNINE
jgi:hypothetical protein